MTRRRGSSPALLVVSIVSLGAAVTQSLLLVRLIVTGKARNATPAVAPSPQPWAGSAGGTTRRPQVPAQDPHSPPTGPIRVSHTPLTGRGPAPEPPETDPHSPPTGPIRVNHTPQSAGAWSR
ncbi:hypothetical protein [Naasia aerilata]|uniref:Secreted protein n=1 Tax=Naasia aerilata TaxID=1162966 RepID=A0ABN6XM75_9MICO|nr:hypothetical protein [Naasia aerilata]BDZ46087.1 hypothetical protein GCM10025866_19960 [Naasia aerilata]